MLTICSSHFTNDCAKHNFDDQNAIIFYNFIGNFIPPEWSDLSSHNGKILSKTARQLLSLIVFRLQIYHNNRIDELQETYNFFEQSLGVCQERVRQCLLELQKAGFIDLRKATIVKYGIKCRNVPCIKLARIFQPHSQKISSEDEKILDSTQKNFGANPKEFLPQPQKSLDHWITIYIIIKIYLINLDMANLKFFKMKKIKLMLMKLIITSNYHNNSLNKIYNLNKNYQINYK
ncbi:hypothetical protein REIP_1332 [Rickettsia endosymbiont of Ixodes pacificus]|uniref:hypothetical protein n=1 Tax=Rickettsia endosymbiont of Ixodes pacificus TaxID=1133329 RepID=UPI00061FB7E6|nr:hypothetical protein [Rickettsia endosymbiont of Ixodes pacificus]KJW03303.1 hypothetical protein REIP_1332 [Rickettsia endosymbiont of Ixodes pacificus]